MAKYTVCEWQEETVNRMWKYTVEADSPEDAIEKAQGWNGEDSKSCPPPEDCGTTGDGDYGPSGWAAALQGEPEPWNEAYENFVADELD